MDLDKKFSEFEKKMQQMVLEAVDAVLIGVQDMIDKLDKKVEDLKETEDSHYKQLRDDIKGLEADLSLAASKQEVEDLRRKIN